MPPNDPLSLKGCFVIALSKLFYRNEWPPVIKYNNPSDKPNNADCYKLQYNITYLLMHGANSKKKRLQYQHRIANVQTYKGRNALQRMIRPTLTLSTVRYVVHLHRRLLHWHFISMINVQMKELMYGTETHSPFLPPPNSPMIDLNRTSRSHNTYVSPAAAPVSLKEPEG